MPSPPMSTTCPPTTSSTARPLESVPSTPRVSERSSCLVLRIDLTHSQWPTALIETMAQQCLQVSLLAHSFVMIATADETQSMAAEAKQEMARAIDAAADSWIPLAFQSTRSSKTLAVSIWHPAIDAARIVAGLAAPIPSPVLPFAKLASPIDLATLPDIQSLPRWPADLASMLSAGMAGLATYSGTKVRRAIASTSFLPLFAHLPASEPTDALLASVQFAAGEYAASIVTCNRMPLAHVKAHVRAGDAWFKMGEVSKAVVRWACAVALVGDNDDQAQDAAGVLGYVGKMLTRVLVEKRVAVDPFEACSDEDEHELCILGSVVAGQDVGRARQRIASAVSKVVMAADWVEPATLPPAYAIHSLPTLNAPDACVRYALPPAFSWLVPHLVAGSSSPRSRTDVQSLGALGIRLVVSATLKALPASWFDGGERMDQVHLVVSEKQAPTLAQLDCFIRLVAKVAPHGRILVHCPSGDGPTATFLAAYLVRFGLAAPPPLCAKCADSITISREQKRAEQDFNSADQIEDDTCTDASCALCTRPTLAAPAATAQIHALRPNSTPSDHAMRDFSTRVLARLAAPTNLPPWDANLPTTPTHVGGTCRFSLANLPRILLLVGLPGSGKSHLARTLQSHLPNTSIVASDDSPSSAAYLAAIGHLARDPSARIVLDACHATPRHRLAALAAAFDPPASEVLAVHVDVPVGVCVERASQRAGHKSLDHRSAARVIAGFAREMRVPKYATPVGARRRARQEVREDKEQDEEDAECKRYGAWIKVQSPAQALALVHQLTRVDALMAKFPRTPHLYAGVESITDDDEIVPDLSQFAASASGARHAENEVWTVEEKVDGANVGVHAVPKVPRSALYSEGRDGAEPLLADVYRVDQAVTLLVQNRSHFVISSDSAATATAAAAAPHPQFAGLQSWLDKHKVTLTHLLLPSSSSSTSSTSMRFVLFGEWTAAKHSVHYPALPDTFLAFDLFDTLHGRFVSRVRFRAHLDRAHAQMRASMCAAGLAPEPEIMPVRQVWSGTGWPSERLGSRQEADAWVRSMGSAYGAEVPEGIVVRKDVGEWLVERAKYVRGDFIAGNQHWTKYGFVANGVVRKEETE